MALLKVPTDNNSVHPNDLQNTKDNAAKHIHELASSASKQPHDDTHNGKEAGKGHC
jgi:hypothetical protein